MSMPREPGQLTDQSKITIIININASLLTSCQSVEQDIDFNLSDHLSRNFVNAKTTSEYERNKKQNVNVHILLKTLNVVL